MQSLECIIAIDFGTAYSGYAFSITPRGKEADPQFRKWGNEQGLETPKTLTCLLLSENEELLKFGHEAKKKYISMDREDSKRHYFFENFKMVLYGKRVNRDTMMDDANGNLMNALKVFREALRYLKEDALQTVSVYATEKEITVSDFTWVLTVPAIWDPLAKQFMREAATEAGIVTNETQHKLGIALEPEAASAWCKKLPADGFITKNYGRGALDRSPGSKYMVVDCGGGTIDITVHEVLDGGALKELHKASGNNLGGQTVDRKFKEFLIEIFSCSVWEEYEKNFPTEVQKIMYEFMYLKQVDDDVQMICPYNLGTLAQKRQGIENFFQSVQGASWDEGSIKISKERLRSFFAESLKGITDSLREILSKNLNIEYMLLVGGYAESQILRQHVIDQFGDQCKVLCPFRPQEAIMKGALTFGRNPGLVTTRKSAFTYGFAICESFDESKHKEEKKYTAEAGELCCDIFRKLVTEGDDVGWNETKTHTLYPGEPHQFTADFSFYRTVKQNPVYVDEDEVEKVGSFPVDLSNTSEATNRKIQLEIKFGSTEITATGTDLVSGSKKSLKLDFMTR